MYTNHSSSVFFNLDFTCLHLELITSFMFSICSYSSRNFSLAWVNIVFNLPGDKAHETLKEERLLFWAKTCSKSPFPLLTILFFYNFDNGQQINYQRPQNSYQKFVSRNSFQKKNSYQKIRMRIRIRLIFHSYHNFYNSYQIRFKKICETNYFVSNSFVDTNKFVSYRIKHHTKFGNGPLYECQWVRNMYLKIHICATISHSLLKVWVALYECQWVRNMYLKIHICVTMSHSLLKVWVALYLLVFCLGDLHGKFQDLFTIFYKVWQ